MNDHSEKEKPALSPLIRQWIAEEAKKLSSEDDGYWWSDQHGSCGYTCCGVGREIYRDQLNTNVEQFALAVAARVQQDTMQRLADVFDQTESEEWRAHEVRDYLLRQLFPAAPIADGGTPR